MSARFSELTTLRVGGPIADYKRLASRATLIKTARKTFESGAEWMVLGGGSNLVVSDEGFPGTVLHVVTKGRSLKYIDDDTVLLTVQAGEEWDGLVAYCVEEGFSGLESLSGIPGSVGASVIQNIGAYGHEVAEVLESIEFLDATSGEVSTLDAIDLALGHRTSALKTGEMRGVVVSVTFRLKRSPLSLPVSYAELASQLGVSEGEVALSSTLREAVIALRRSKGMVLDEQDVDSRSVGSFFVNPVVSEKFAYQLPTSAPKWFLDNPADQVVSLGESGTEVIKAPEAGMINKAEPRVKLSAAWLIEHSGIGKGFSLPGSAVRVSTKHTLAITNPDGGSAAEVGELARYIRTQVANKFGVILQPEPVLEGIDLG